MASDKKTIILISLTATLVCTALALTYAGCGKRDKTPAKPDFALVTIDGNFSAEEMRAAFPDLLIFTNAYTTAPFTLPAAASILTSVPPSEHGLHIDGVGSLDPNIPTTANMLSEEGFICGAFLSSLALAPIHGLTNGFSVYDLKLVSDSPQTRRTRNSTEVVDAAIAWLDEIKPTKNPRFIWVHLPRETNTLAEVSRLFSKLADDSYKSVTPLFGNGENRMFSLDDSVVRINIAVSETVPLPLTPRNFDFFGDEKVYSENLMPWYLFRMPPLATKPVEIAITIPARMEQATQTEYFFLRANGHYGEGLIPPLTKTVAVSALSHEDADFAARALAALASPADSNNFAVVSALAKERPGIPALHSRLGEIFYGEKKFIEAYSEFAKADDAGLNMTQSVRMMSKCHMAIGNIMPAIDQAENAFLMNPSDAMLRRELADLLLRVGASLLEQKQYASAMDFLTRVNFLEPQNPHGLFSLAQLHLATGQTNSAAAYLREIQTLRPGDKTSAALLKEIGK
ncbi:MAG: tetratricopeptide repeat protein [Kiritimatiellaeota bacterium]|nr:tetratricopeptide repeat protein [Kiritimatiellota bacterium]